MRLAADHGVSRATMERLGPSATPGPPLTRPRGASLGENGAGKERWRGTLCHRCGGKIGRGGRF